MTTSGDSSATDARETVVRAGFEEPVAGAPSDTEYAVGNRHRDPVRWSAIWAGALVAMATFILLELIFFALGWLTLDEGAGTTAGWVTGLIGLLAFFIGGLAAGATSIWTGTREGVVHGMLVWALGVVGILLLALFGGGALLGSAASVFAELASAQRPDVSGADVTQAVDAARDNAGWAVVGLLLSLSAATIGGACGVKIGSGKQHTTVTKAH